MGYNQYCLDQTCSQNCCNFDGYCPMYYSGSLSQCYYYYTVSSNTIIGAVVASVAAVILVVALSCYCYRKRQAEKKLTSQRRVNAQNSTEQNITMGQNYVQATNGQATNGQATNGQATNGQATNGQATNTHHRSTIIYPLPYAGDYYAQQQPVYKN